MKYIFLLLTIVSESAAVILMKFSEGFTNKLYGIFAVFCYGISFIFLTLALKQLPAGIANAIWGGTSVILVVVGGMIFFKEQVSLMQIIFIAMIIIGIAGLQFNG